MKKMISKIALATLVISAMPMHAELSQTTQSTVHSILKTIGDNPVLLAYAGTLMATYWFLFSMKFGSWGVKKDEAGFLGSVGPRTDAAWRLAIDLVLIGVGATAFSAACRWAGSRI